MGREQREPAATNEILAKKMRGQIQSRESPTISPARRTGTRSRVCCRRGIECAQTGCGKSACLSNLTRQNSCSSSGHANATRHPDLHGASSYTVRPVEMLRYLGFFLHWRLNWEPHCRIMANRARATLKALTVLGNTIRGLSMANWRLAFNAVCLPVLSYGCQLWLRTGFKGQKKLVDLLQKVQNEGVRMVTGAFRTAPRAALLHIARMLPMRQYLEKLTQTSAIRLYSLPRGSQLLRRLGPEWYVPRQGDLPLAVPTNATQPGRANRCPTILEALAVRIPANGPHVDVTKMAPWEVPNWTGRLRIWDVVNPQTRREWTSALYGYMDTLSIAAVHVASKLTNVGRPDGKVVGGAAATMKLGVQRGEGLAERSCQNWACCKAFDTSCFGLAKTMVALTTRFSSQKPPDHIYIFCSDSSAIRAVTNPRSKSAHDAALLFHASLTALCDSHANSKFTLVWTPVDFLLEEQEVARALATEACQCDPLSGLKRIMMAAYQKDDARKQAFQTWAHEWHRGQQDRSSGTKPCSFAYTHTLTKPPDRGSHPLWQAATAKEKNTQGVTPKSPFSRNT